MKSTPRLRRGRRGRAGGFAPGATPVRLNDVSKVYATRGGDPVHAVNGLTLDCKAGEFVSLLGPSGCGKSTVLLMVAGLIPRSSGTITIGDTVVERPYTDLGFVFQDAVLL